MIEVRYNEQDYWLEVSGHANYASCGSDIVCAGVSGICEALIGVAIDRNSRVLPAISRNPGKGHMRIRLYPEKERDKLAAHVMLDMAYIGLERIETQFVDYIHCSRTKEEI